MTIKISKKSEIACLVLLVVLLIISMTGLSFRYKQLLDISRKNQIKMKRLDRIISKLHSKALPPEAIETIHGLAGSTIDLMISYPIDFKGNRYVVQSSFYDYLSIMSISKRVYSSYWSVHYMAEQLMNSAFNDEPIPVTEKQFKKLQANILRENESTRKFSSDLLRLTQDEIKKKYFSPERDGHSWCMNHDVQQGLSKKAQLIPLIDHLFRHCHFIIVRTDVSARCTTNLLSVRHKK